MFSCEEEYTAHCNSLAEVENMAEMVALEIEEAQEYQKAWNKIAEYMNKSGILSFHVSPWDANDNDKYSLITVNTNPDGTGNSYAYHFVAEQERPQTLWIK